MRKLDPKLVEVVYQSIMAGNSGEAVAKLRGLGPSTAEAESVYSSMESIAKKTGSLESFRAVLDGEDALPIQLTPREMAALSGGNEPAGSTWEGSGGKTWGG